MPFAQPPLDLLPVFNAQPGATLLLSPELVIVGASDDYLTATLTQRDAIVGQHIFDAFPDNPEAPEANAVANVRASLEQVLATKQLHEMPPQHYDVPDPARPGHFVERHWQPRHTPVLDAQGQVQFIIQSVQDITVRQLAERQLRDSQANELAARAETTLQRQQLYHVLEQAPAMICIFDGPQHTFQFVNPPYQALVGDRPLVGKPIAEAMPELAGQPIFGLLDRVYQTGETFYAHEMLVQLDHHNEGRSKLEKRYYNFIYQARRDRQGAIDGILVFAYEVTPQVQARQQVQTLNEELAAANEELQATNDEFLASNAALSQTQQQLQQANEALTAAVATAEAARLDAEAQRQRFYEVLQQLPAQVAVYHGPAHVFSFINARFGSYVESGTLLGLPVREAARGAVGEEVFRQLDQVYATGQPAEVHELKVALGGHTSGAADAVYRNAFYLPLRDTQGRIDGVLDFSYDVTEQVRARRQVEQLNQELELRVTARSAETKAALLEAQQQREQARRQQALLGQILGQMPAAIATLRGPEHQYAYFNAAYHAISAERTVLGQPVATVFPELVEQGILDLLDRVYTTGEPFLGTEILLMIQDPATGQPEPRYLDFTYQPLLDEQQRTEGVLVFALDVTERVRSRKQADTLQAAMLAVTKQHAQERENAYQLFEQAPAAVCLLREPDHRIGYFNPAYQALFPGKQLRGQTLAQVQPDNAALVTLFNGVYDGGQTQFQREVPVSVAQADGQPPLRRYFDFTYQAYQEDGRIVGVSLFGFDVTERVQAAQAVKDNAQRLRLLTDALPVLIGYLDRDHRYRFTNRAYEAWFHQPADALLGRAVREVVGEAAYQNTKGYMDRALAGERLDFRVRMPYREGFVKHIHTHYIPDVQHGRVAGFFTLVTDETVQVEARERVQELNEELAAINEEVQATNKELHASNAQLLRTNADLDTFVYAASHDLKAPIANIEGLLEALREYLPPHAQEPMVPRLVGMMEGAIQRFQQTIAHLADVTRLQNGSDPELDDVDLPAILEDVRLDVLPLLESTQTQLVLDVPACPGVRVSTKHLRSILFNLLSNAVKYRAPGRAPLVQVRAHCLPGQLVLEVQDNGLGLNEHQQGQLFTMFRRLHTHVEGSGVGLYLIKRMIDLSEGTIAVASQPGVGSTFTVTLPRA